jgi:hypothetical protein
VITLAIVDVLSDPVMPSRTWASSQFREIPCPLATYLILEEVLLVHFLDLVGLLGPDTHAVVEQQRGETWTVDQDDLLFDPRDVVVRLGREQRGGDKDAFAGAHTLKATRERLNIGPREIDTSISCSCLGQDRLYWTADQSET